MNIAVRRAKHKRTQHTAVLWGGRTMVAHVNAVPHRAQMPREHTPPHMAHATPQPVPQQPNVMKQVRTARHLMDWCVIQKMDYHDEKSIYIILCVDCPGHSFRGMHRNKDIFVM